MNEPEAPTASPSTRDFPIVGIGASAGGLEAFRKLLGALPTDTGMAYVLVQHLDPHHESILSELLSEATGMEVAEVKGDVRVKPDRVYVIPPTSGLILEQGLLRLVPRTPSHMPIDSFFRTLAAARGSQAVGVILSGMGSDGTLGLRAIEAEGGIAFAQEPGSAQNADMPKSAIAAGCVDFVLTPEDIARELARLGRHPFLAHPDPAGTADPGKADDEALGRILGLLRSASGTDFGEYKKTTLLRRIARRMVVMRVDSLADYARRIEHDAGEVGALYEDCLISVTSFFRDPAVFTALSDQVLPALLKNRSSDSPLRVWVPGCATGEEVYSIAMCLLERAAELSSNPPLQIFATDLGESVLAKARAGLYLPNIAGDVSPERLERFFAKVDGKYQISKTIREMCVFARHDLTSDPPFSRIDLISCRNVLIYLEPRLQARVFATFHYALRPDGFLIVGPAETASSGGALFSAVDEPHRIYARMAATGPPALRFKSRDPRPDASARPVRPTPAKPVGVSGVLREIDRILLARFAPAAVVVDEGLRVIEFRGETNPYLEHGQGRASLKLDRLLRKGLLMEVRQAIDEARRSEASVRRENLQVRYLERVRTVDVEVIPIRGLAAGEKCLLVLFEAARHPIDPTETSADGAPQDGTAERLGQQLSDTTEYLGTLVREHEAALEELQSSTEEAVSNNEELQSVNEELQTAKEEIQSANEELITLNQELQDRNVQLADSNDLIRRALGSANAVVDTARQPLLILDGDLRVERANAAFYHTFRDSPDQVVGRPLAELSGGRWGRPALLVALRAVLTTGATVDDLEVDADFPGLGPRTLSVDARQLHREGGAGARLLLAIDDKTKVRLAERERDQLMVREHDARERAEAADRMKDEFVATVSHELRGPLTVISGWTNVLLRAGPTPDHETLLKALAAIGRGITAQGRLISDLLDHSRIVMGKIELRRFPLDLLLVAESAMEGVRAAAEAKDITLAMIGEPGESIVLGDPDRLQQVVWNLLFNAVKFTSRGGSVRVTVDRVGNQVRVTVIDTGCGISAEFLPYVFQRFRQAEGSSSRTQPGLGLGLTLVRELAELHGGTVGAESAGEGRGSTFVLVLPIPALLQAPTIDQPTPVPSSRRHSTRAPMPEPAHDALAGTTVLVVDDETDAREALVTLLERYGAEVRSASSVAGALTELAKHLPHVLVSDIGMPGEDGYELIRRLRLLPPEAGGRLPTVALTAYATDEHRRRVVSSGFQRHLEKPVSPAELVSEVARLAARNGLDPSRMA